MPLLTSSYNAPRWLRGGHRQTILPVLLPRRASPWQRRERLERPDGDFLVLGWLQSGHARLALLSHGLEGPPASEPAGPGVGRRLHGDDEVTLSLTPRRSRG